MPKASGKQRAHREAIGRAAGIWVGYEAGVPGRQRSSTGINAGMKKET